ncbi:MAG: single-stranded-DNA-specific exonuclease RecJ, partial [Phycisphaerae bacterium]|nr:single-stranded-DNA-specific exonuclease RecJ [Phycisphaerae bacterium]
WHCLKLVDADVHCYVPHRIEEGYGLNCQAITDLAGQGAKLIISVDCGISAFEPAKVAADAGLDLIITDHHRLDSDLPACCAIVHPALPDTHYPCQYLSGAGVAFKLAWFLAQRFSDRSNGPSSALPTRVSDSFREFLISATGLAALGTIADVVPLTGENRILAAFGLKGLAGSTYPGIQALIESAGLTGSALDSYDIGFKLAPRINAAGRMGHARLALDLLTGAAKARAAKIAAYLEQQNRQRRKVEKDITDQAVRLVTDQKLDTPDTRAFVLAQQGWHAGVIGIVASRIVGRFHRPTVMIAVEDGQGQGSARSIPGFNIFEAFHACRQYLTTFGGHAMAAGLTISAENIPPFTEAFTEYAADHLDPADLQPVLRIDAAASLDMITEELLIDINRLAPFGQANPRPLLVTEACTVVGEPRAVGKTKKTLQFTVARDKTTRKCVAFGQARLLKKLAACQTVSLAYRPILNEFNGYRSAELQVEDMHFNESAK